MSVHPGDALLAEFAQGQLWGPPRDELERHVEECQSCRTLLAGLLEALQSEGLAATREGQR
jgi:hypothetical protein